MATVFASAQRVQETATYNSDVVLPRDAVGLLFHLNISAVTATPTLDIKLQYYDTVTATYEDLLDSAGNGVAFVQKTGTGEDDLTVAPGLIEKLTGTNRRYSQLLPRKFRVVATVGNAGGDKVTFSLASVVLGA